MCFRGLSCSKFWWWSSCWELLTCLTVAEKALLWPAPRSDLEAIMVLEASMMYTEKVQQILSERNEAIAGCEMRSNGWDEKALELGHFRFVR